MAFGLNVLPSRRTKLPCPFFAGPSLWDFVRWWIFSNKGWGYLHLSVDIITLPSARQWVVWGVPTPSACSSQGSITWSWGKEVVCKDQMLIFFINTKDLHSPCQALVSLGLSSHPPHRLGRSQAPAWSVWVWFKISFALAEAKKEINKSKRTTKSINCLQSPTKKIGQSQSKANSEGQPGKSANSKGPQRKSTENNPKNSAT